MSPDQHRVLWINALAVFAAALMPPILTLSSPSIHQSLRLIGHDTPALVMKIYLVATIFMVMGGTASDLLGRRLLLAVALSVYSMTLILCTVRVDARSYFVIVDMINGIAGVMVLPLAIASVCAHMPLLKRMPAFSILLIVGAFGQISSPMVYTTLQDAWDGRAVFLPALVLALISLLLISRLMPESRLEGVHAHRGALINAFWMIVIFTVIFNLLNQVDNLRVSTLVLAITLGLLAVFTTLHIIRRRVPAKKIDEILQRERPGYGDPGPARAPTATSTTVLDNVPLRRCWRCFAAPTSTRNTCRTIVS